MGEGSDRVPSRIDRFGGEFRWLSNFWPSGVRGDDGHDYPTVEHAYQASKATCEEERQRVASAATPKKAKHRGRAIRTDPTWESRRVAVMRALLERKFRAGTELAARLLATGEAELVEGNDFGDTFWGVCDGVGENTLGRLLMEVRASLRQSLSSDERSR